MRFPVRLTVCWAFCWTVLFAFTAAIHATVTITASNRFDELVSVFQDGGGCDDFTASDTTTAFGVFNESVGTPGIGTSASHNSSLTAAGLFTGTLKSQYIGAPDCQIGNHGLATGCVQFTVTGTAIVHITAIMNTTLTQLGASSALIEIRKNPVSLCDGGVDFYTRFVSTNSTQYLPVEDSILLSAGNYRLKVSCISQDVSVNSGHSSKAQLDFWITLGQLENDDCDDAIFVAPNTNFAFDTSAATTDGPADQLCLNALDDQIHKDIWYRIYAPCSGFMTVSTCGSATFDTRIAIYDGCPNLRNPRLGGTLLSCDDDTVFCPFATTKSTILAAAGEEYLIRVGGYNNGSGTGNLLVTCGQLYDSCTSPLAVEEEVIPFTTEGADSLGPHLPGPCIAAGNDEINQDIWLVHTSECTGRLQVSTCSAADFDTRLAIYDTSCPTAGSPVLACNDDTTGCTGLTSFVALDVSDGELLYIRLGGYQANSGEGELTVRCLSNPADLNDDGIVDGADLGLLLGAWNLGGFADINMNGVVDGADLGLLLGAWTG